MPIREMWQNGNVLDPVGEIDSNGSCDSVVSFNSCFSDENLEYLSAEEKACLMYLEQTIQSLDMEDDSGLSNNKSDQPPARGNVANKAAHLSASIGLNKIPSQDVPKSQIEGPLSSNLVQNENLNCMIPTSNRNSQIQTRPGLAASQKKTSPKVPSKSTQLLQEAPRVPSKVNVVVMPPPVSTNNDLVGSTSSRGSKPTPPPVAPKPKMKIPHQVSMNKKGASNSKTGSTTPYSGVLPSDKLMNPEKVRVEALCKLGLLKEDRQNPDSQQLKYSQSPAELEQNQNTSERLAPSIPVRSGRQINQQIQSCNPLHQRSMTVLSTASSPPQHADMISSTGKSATVERTGMGLPGSNITVLSAVSQNQKTDFLPAGAKKKK